MTRELFYDAKQVAILPVGVSHPGSGDSVTATVRSWREHWPNVVPLPHPSPRNNIWLRRNPWFETDLLPLLRLRVAEALSN